MGGVLDPGVGLLMGGRAGVQVEEDGIVFFRESCFRQSGDKARKSNPTHYRFVSLGALIPHAIVTLNGDFPICDS